MEEILQALNIEKLNQMQEKTLLANKNSNNWMLLAPTGSGKTLAFLLSILENLDENHQIEEYRAIIICPTRELVLQTESVWRKMKTGHKINACYGGHDMKTEINNLATPPKVFIGTPGRLVDHFRRKTINANELQILVIDEFDKCLEMGFEKEMNYIVDLVKKRKKTFVTSATIMEELNAPLFDHLKFETLDFLEKNKVEHRLSYQVVKTDKSEKSECLKDLICYINTGKTIVFCNHRDAVERISFTLTRNNISHELYHGGLKQDMREINLLKFKNGSADILVCTDLAARGIDVPFVENVIHYQNPLTEDVFIHRNGRTARVNETGNIYSIISDEDTLPAFMQDKFNSLEIPISTNLPKQALYTTMYVNGGKKEKISKGDILGFLLKNSGLTMEDIGIIEIKDHASYIAIKKEKIEETLHRIKKEKLKKKSFLFQIAR